MEEEIKNWLAGMRDYAEGVALYLRYGNNLMYKNIFAHKNTAATRAMLLEELRKLAHVTKQELATMPRKAWRGDAKIWRGDAPVPHDQACAEDTNLKDSPDGERATGGAPLLTDGAQGAGAPPLHKSHLLKFRERFPFLSAPDCPDELKVMVSDMFTAYDAYREAHAALAAGDGRGNAPVPHNQELAEKTVENYLNNRAMWEELEYYKEHGVILGKYKKATEEEEEDEVLKKYAAMTDVELQKALASARTNLSKARKNGNEEKLATWEERKAAIEAEIENRKKK